VLVLYSDGLIERRGEQLDVGMRRLLDELREGGSGEPETVADRILAGLIEEVPQDDDVAVLCVRAAPIVAPFVTSMPAQPDALWQIRRDVRSWLQEAAVSEEVRDEVVLACNEACANAVEHAYASAAAPITVSLSRSDSSILVEVADTGTWLERGAGAHRGHGFDIMRAVMDDVDVTASPEGTLIRMRRRIA
jgi:anti-sigma regulatory factor (Ser/Thr protein kinase)